MTESEPGPRPARAGMTETIIIVDTSEVREGRLEDLRAAMNALVGYARANEPRMIAYGVYISPDEGRVTVVQVHPDSASAEFHMRVAAAAFAPFAELLRMARIDVYGTPGDELLRRLHRKAELLGGGAVAVHDLHAGFSRFGPPGGVTGN